MEKQGYPVQEITKSYEQLINSTRRLGYKNQLLATVCLEHITEITSEWALTYPTILSNAHPHFKEIWYWHCKEEIEHRGVAYDVMMNVGGESNKRIFILLVTFNIFSTVLQNTFLLLKTDNQLWKWKTFKDMWSVLLSRKNGLLPLMFLRWLQFMRKDFHPCERNLDHLVSG